MAVNWDGTAPKATGSRLPLGLRSLAPPRSRRVLMFATTASSGVRRKHGGDALWVDIERQESERLVAGISPLVDEAERLIDQCVRPLRLRLAVRRVGPRSGDDEI